MLLSCYPLHVCPFSLPFSTPCQTEVDEILVYCSPSRRKRLIIPKSWIKNSNQKKSFLTIMVSYSYTRVEGQGALVKAEKFARRHSTFLVWLKIISYIWTGANINSFRMHRTHGKNDPCENMIQQLFQPYCVVSDVHRLRNSRNRKKEKFSSNKY